VQKVLEGGAGMQKPLASVLEGVEEILKTQADYALRAQQIVAKSRGAAAITWEAISSFLQKNLE
jgi:hypothetical protein